MSGSELDLNVESVCQNEFEPIVNWICIHTCDNHWRGVIRLLERKSRSITTTLV
jgi:hypothetical protein